MKLEDYRKNRGLTLDQLASHLEIKRGTVYNICKGETNVTLQNAIQIINKTGGAVLYEDLIVQEG